MKLKKILALLLVLTMFLGCMILPSAAESTATDVWDGTSSTTPTGNGGVDTPFQISNGAELKWMYEQVSEKANVFANKYFIVIADIDLGGHEWAPIGTEAGRSFRGIFDGQGHTISNFKVTGKANSGLFGALVLATVKNLTLDKLTVKTVEASTGFGGALVGYMDRTTVTNVIIGKDVSVTGYNVGGIVGRAWNQSNTISYCVNNATLSTDGKSEGECVGGIVGLAKATVISYCINNGIISTVANKEQLAGGISGSFNGVNSVSYCLNTGSITSTHTAGEIVGKNTVAGCTYENCVSVGTIVKGALTDYSGTLIGRFTAKGTVTNCYAKYTPNYGVTGKNATSLNNCTQTNVNICQTEEELKTLNAYATAIEKAVARQSTLRPFVVLEGVNFKAVQEYVHDGKFNVRFVASVDDYTKYSAIGFTVTASYTEAGVAMTKNFEKNCNSVYSALNAVDGNVAYPESAVEWQGNSLAAYSIRNIPTSVGEVTFTVTVFYELDGVHTDCQAYRVVYNNGEFVSAAPVEA